MSKKNGTTKERASVSRERRLALALRAVLDAGADIGARVLGADEAHARAELDANSVLNDLGYSTLEGIPKRLVRLNEQLQAALAAGDGATIAKLGLELEKAKAGKASSEPAPKKVRQPRQPKLATDGSKSSTSAPSADEQS